MNTSFALDHKHLLDNLQIGIIIHGKDSEIVYANYRALQIMDMTWSEMTGQTIHGTDWNIVDKYKKVLPKESYPVAIVMSTKQNLDNYEIGVMNKGSIVSWMLCSAHPKFDEVGSLVQVVVTLIDTTNEHEEIPFKNIVDLASDIIVVTEAKRTPKVGHKIVYVNNAFTQLTGFESEEAIGSTPKMLQGEITSKETTARIGAALDKKQPIRERIYNYSKAGRGYWLDINIVPMPNEYGEVLYFAAVQRDITTQQEKEDHLSSQANRDRLTQLLNRRGFDKTAEIEIESALENSYPLAFALADADYFKKINDTYGHDIGDKVLCELAKIMQLSFRKSDILGRFGGEEFIIAMINSPEEVLRKMNEFRERVANTSIEISSSSSLHLTISIGVAFLGKNNNNLKALVKSADSALYNAKGSGRNKVCIYAG
jgi:diguanylate cyclase (GGDEF)-like protein/PAS domain S-box-containing protein